MVKVVSSCLAYNKAMKNRQSKKRGLDSLRSSFIAASSTEKNMERFESINCLIDYNKN